MGKVPSTPARERPKDESLMREVTDNVRQLRRLVFFPINLFIYLSIYLWLRWVFIAARGLSLVVVSRGYSSLQCTGFSLQWFLLLQSMGSRCAGFSSCGARASLLCGMRDLPRPGLKPVSPAVAGGFLTTEPPGKSRRLGFNLKLIWWAGVHYKVSWVLSMWQSQL